MAKAGIVSSTPGVKGGYKLAKLPEEISFWDVFEAVEGKKPIFQCKNILKTNLKYRDNEECTSSTQSNPIINLAMLEAEEHMHEALRKKTLAWLNRELDHVLPEKVRTGSRNYFMNNNLN